MEKEVGALRCSKLNCYAEFNKMVQALSHCRHPTIQTMPGARNMQGTSREYNFYHTLASMLQQVASNRNTKSQKRELQKVYEWFTLSKPLMRPKTTASTPKPRFGLTSREGGYRLAPAGSGLLERPQTAPPSLYKRSELPPKKESRPRMAFTSQYVSRSLGHNLDLVGQTFDRLESVPSTSEKRLSTTSKTKRRPSSGKPSAQLSVQAHPQPDFLSGYTPPGQSTVHSRMVESVCFGEVFAYAPTVAAQITIEKSLLDKENSALDGLRSKLARTRLRMMNSPYAPSNSPINPPVPVPATRVSLATETRSEESLRAALKLEEEKASQSEANTDTRTQIMMSAEEDDLDSPINQKLMEEVERLISDETIESCFSTLPVEQEYSHLSQLETIREAEPELAEREQQCLVRQTSGYHGTTTEESQVKAVKEVESRESIKTQNATVVSQECTNFDNVTSQEEISSKQSSSNYQESTSKRSSSNYQESFSEGDSSNNQQKSSSTSQERNRYVNAEESQCATPIPPSEPRVLITSSCPPAPVKSSTHPKKSPAVVSITFPAEHEHRQSSNHSSRRPRKTPFSVAGFRRNRYKRPQTVPAMKIQSMRTA